jgi:uncharacterized membrane protein
MTEEPLIRWSLGLPPASITGTLCLLVLLATLVLSWRNLRVVRDPRVFRRALAMKAGMLALLAAAVLDPVRTEQVMQPRQAQTVVLVDDSLSIALGSGPGQDRARDLLDAMRTLADRLPAARFVDLGGHDLDRTAAPRLQRTESPILQRLEEWATTGIDGAIPERIGVISDLNDAGPAPSSEALFRLMRALSAGGRPRLFAVDLGGHAGAPDVAVTGVRHDTLAFYKNVTGATVDVEVNGFTQGKLRVEFGVDGEWTGSSEVALEPGQARYTVPFRYRPDRVGDLLLSARVSPPSGIEEANGANNLVYVRQKVVRDRLRVLHLAGHPSWDVRFLRDLVRDMGNVDLISFYVMVKPSSFFVEDMENTALIPFPTDTLFQKELGGFDLVVFQDFRFGAFDTDQYAADIVNYVKNGGAALILGGELTFLNEQLPKSPIAELFPVAIPESRAYRDYFAFGAVNPRVAPGGAHHEVLNAGGMPADLPATLASLPPLEGTNLQGCPREGATVLLEHPHARTACGPLPLLTVAELGQGRTAMVGTDSLWLWAFRPGQAEAPALYRALLTNLLDWLIRDPDLAPFRLRVEPDTAGPGVEVTLKAEPLGSGEPVEETWALRVTRAGEETHQAPVVRKAERPEFRWVPSLPGLYWLEVERRGNPAPARISRPFLVAAGPDELREPSPRRDALRNAILAGGGPIVPPAQVAGGLDLPVPKGQVMVRSESSEPFRSVWVLLALLALLAGEWYLRSIHGG